MALDRERKKPVREEKNEKIKRLQSVKVVSPMGKNYQIFIYESLLPAKSINDDGGDDDDDDDDRDGGGGGDDTVHYFI
ncbi:unnamed protein product [Litomosoides sigmodontis]|uniref:Uncharacterized protein n=1 Tax=Litomosoides sigmodontis TaxID=42156 RepID=A0A3P7M9N6_LITSI|nr:unnamed protein product [Litomosoides sigmodontis]